jgi:hypothetical protein
VTALRPDRLVATTIGFSLLALATSARAQYPTPLAPLAWWNDASDVTLGLWARTNPTPLGRFTLIVSRGFGGQQAATIEESVDFHIQVEDPFALTNRGFSGLLAGWAMDGTVGTLLRLSRPTGSPLTGTETGVQLQWVATREIRYLDPSLWDNTGTGEAGVFHTRRSSTANQDLALRLDGLGGVAYSRSLPGQSGSGYAAEAFARAAGEVSIRRRLSFLVFGARGYAGGIFSANNPPKQRAIPIQGGDPYQTLGNPWFRTEGAPLAGGDVFYHAPGHANLRGYRLGEAGRWAGSINLELEADVFRRETGIFRRASLVGFWDGAIVDTLAARTFDDTAFRVMADAGAGFRIWFSIASLHFPLRVEFPVYLSDPVLAYDRERARDYVEFRWLVSVQPIF